MLEIKNLAKKKIVIFLAKFDRFLIPKNVTEPNGCIFSLTFESRPLMRRPGSELVTRRWRPRLRLHRRSLVLETFSSLLVALLLSV